jgi:hypothetical protein
MMGKKMRRCDLTMTNGENRQKLVFSDTLNKMLDEIIADKTVTALIITSNDEKNFSQGIDVEWILDKLQKKEYKPVNDFILGMDRVFKKLLLYPVPVIAAINGHAYGNGPSCPALRFSVHRVPIRGFFVPGSEFRHSLPPRHDCVYQERHSLYSFRKCSLPAIAIPRQELKASCNFKSLRRSGGPYDKGGWLSPKRLRRSAEFSVN